MSAALTDHPLPAGISRYYYEVLIEDGNHPMKSQTSLASIVIGFCSRFTSQESREVSLDSKIFSQWSYHCDGRIYQLGSKSYHFEREEEFGHGDVVGAGIDFRERTVFFTKNGKRLEHDFHGQQVKGRLFPVIAMKHIKVRVNFGSRPFKYDWSP
ncbi:concanavalin A-like lectin/glucanase domain-containing protein [Phyllosticta citricarpa]|uniref:Concanavalin A-like lectin/glucanase domain-containing protein n=1 Tax=Phyllosticta citricarpa TaxID=55181 RepID=A0ABR1MS82_9PEZI